MSMTDEEIELQVATIRIACDEDSPFKGMVDMSDLLLLDVDDARSVWDAMGEELQKQFTKIYMTQGESKNDNNHEKV